MTAGKRLSHRFRVRRSAHLVTVTALLGLLGPGIHTCAQDALPMKDVRIPIDRYPDGTIHRQLHAAAASMPQTGPILGQGVRVESFDPAGKLEMVVDAVQCEYNRSDGMVTSEEAVKAQARGIVLTGVGFTLDTKGQQIRVLDDVRVEFNRKQTKRETKR